LSRAAVLGKTITDISTASKDRAAALQQMIQGVVTTGQADGMEVSWTRSDGKVVCHHIRAVPELDDDGAVVSVLTVARDITDLKETEQSLLKSQAQLQDLSARRENAREEERKRIARDLHEELGQMLTALRMGVSTLPLRYGDTAPGLADRSRGMLELIDQTIRGVRDVVTSLRPTVLDTGIEPGLEWLAREFTRHNGVECVVHAVQVRPKLPDTVATAVFRVAQEALTNIARHAQAERVDMTLERKGQEWILQIRDDGDGFDPSVRHPEAMGIAGMEERALMLGGTLDIASQLGFGTTVTLRFPIR
jgi:PAS domain S-box-containing protein